MDWVYSYSWLHAIISNLNSAIGSWKGRIWLLAKFGRSQPTAVPSASEQPSPAVQSAALLRLSSRLSYRDMQIGEVHILLAVSLCGCLGSDLPGFEWFSRRWISVELGCYLQNLLLFLSTAWISGCHGYGCCDLSVHHQVLFKFFFFFSKIIFFYKNEHLKNLINICGYL